ncbi:MAG: MAPEG family protein [bacterium]|nr:MAPEG family protein [bacterium]
MNNALFSLIGFAVWGIILGISIVSWRGILGLMRVSKLNEFPAGERHGSDLYWRLNRAHLNTLENLPIMASVIFVAWAAGTITPIVESLAQWAFVARLCQSLVHISSGSNLAVLGRASFLLVQYLCFAGIAYLAAFK